MAYTVGEIVHVAGFPVHPPKGKYCIFVHVGPNWFFLINTENRKDYDCIPLLKKGRPFPTHDSYIGCKNIFQAEDSQITSKHGKLDSAELKALLQKVRDSKFIPQDKKKIIVAGIEQKLKS